MLELHDNGIITIVGLEYKPHGQLRAFLFAFGVYRHANGSLAKITSLATRVSSLRRLATAVVRSF
jgi:hypothetical protein